MKVKYLKYHTICEVQMNDLINESLSQLWTLLKVAKTKSEKNSGKIRDPCDSGTVHLLGKRTGSWSLYYP